MNQRSLFIPFFFLILRISFCSVDPKFLACQPMTCGNNQNISYPFYIKGKQQAFCGNPGFELSCNNNGFPILNLTSTNYIVQEIFYNNHTIRLTNEVFSESTTSDQCISQIQKFSVGKYNFYVAPNQTEVLLFYGCDLTLLPETLKSDKIGCSHENKTRSVVASYREDQSLKEACKGDVVKVTVEDGEGGIKEALTKGFVLNWNASHCDACTRSGGRCGFDLNPDIYAFRCYCRDRPHAADCDPWEDNESTRRRELTIGVAVAVVVSAFLIWTFIIICCFRSKTSRWKINICMARKGDQDVEAFFKNHGDLNMKRYKFSDLKKMTNAFKEKLGQGGFGVVYKGKLLNGCPVAVKILKSSKKEGADFINEVASISRTSHVNVVALLGFSFEGHKKALIYEFMANGSLEKFIYKNVGESETTPSPSLSWEILNDIAKGIARGLEYLHRGCNTRILHFDIKPHNILLDENFCPKISDFGLAKLCPRNESIISMSEARGTIGYVAPEVWNRHFGGVSHKSDVYSYGMMLLEMVGGRKNINAQASHSSEIYFPHWIYTKLEVNEAVTISTAEDDIAKKLTLVGLWCIQTFPNDRPTIRKVVEMLEGNVNSLEMPPKPVLSSPPRSEPESSTT